MVPSSFMISQITPLASNPAMRARSQAASVWPARASTPPGCAISGKMWPGLTMSSALAFFATAACTVRARSAAEMPVVTPSAASMETVNLVPKPEPLRGAISGSEQLAAFAGHGHADQAAGEARHEIDVLGGHALGGDNDVALVLAVLVIHEDDHLAGADVFDQFFSGIERHRASPQFFR